MDLQMSHWSWCILGEEKIKQTAGSILYAIYSRFQDNSRCKNTFLCFSNGVMCQVQGLDFYYYF